MNIASETATDPILSKMLSLARVGWPQEGASGDPALKPYFFRRNELSVERECVMWDLRVITPSSLRNRLLDDLHNTHLCTARSKAIAHSHFWRPNCATTVPGPATTYHAHHYHPGCGPPNRSREYMLTFHLSWKTLPHRGTRPFQVVKGHWSNGNHYSQSHNRRTAHHLCKVWRARKSSL